MMSSVVHGKIFFSSNGQLVLNQEIVELKKKSCSQEGSSSESNGSTYTPLHSQCLAWFPRERKTTMNVCLRSKAEGDIFSIKKEKAKKKKHLRKKKYSKNNYRNDIITHSNNSNTNNEKVFCEGPA